MMLPIEELCIGRLSEEPASSALHLAAVGHYIDSSNSVTLSTLNFDGLLEKTLSYNLDDDVYAKFDGSEEPYGPSVHHLHGMITRSSAVSPVVGFRDYAELIAHEDPWQKAFLSKALSRGPLFLAGTSYRDPDIRHWLHLILRDEKPEYKALVTIVRQGLGLDKKMFESVSNALTKQWEAIGLTALKMHDLSDVALVIRELQYLNYQNYMSPKARAKRVWNSHNKQILKLQPEFSKQLTHDASILADAMDAKVRRGTLWLSNAKGQLARWSVKAPIFIRKFLKYIPTGHDSPWIAPG